MEIKTLKTQILFSLYILTSKVILSHRPYVIEIKSLQYTYNKEHVKVFELKIVKYNNHSAFSARVAFSRDIHDFYMDFKALVPKVKRRPWVFINTTVNGCEFLRGIRNKQLNWIYILYNEIKQFQGFPTKCPIKKDKLIYVPHLYIDSEKSPPYLPVFNLDFFMVSRQKDAFFYNANFSLNVVEKKRKFE